VDGDSVLCAHDGCCDVRPPVATFAENKTIGYSARMIGLRNQIEMMVELGFDVRGLCTVEGRLYTPATWPDLPALVDTHNYDTRSIAEYPCPVNDFGATGVIVRTLPDAEGIVTAVPVLWWR
jgi:hypothetical protein